MAHRFLLTAIAPAMLLGAGPHRLDHPRPASTTNAANICRSRGANALGSLDRRWAQDPHPHAPESGHASSIRPCRRTVNVAVTEPLPRTGLIRCPAGAPFRPCRR